MVEYQNAPNPALGCTAALGPALTMTAPRCFLYMATGGHSTIATLSPALLAFFDLLSPSLQIGE